MAVKGKTVATVAAVAAAVAIGVYLWRKRSGNRVAMDEKAATAVDAVSAPTRAANSGVGASKTTIGFPLIGARPSSASTPKPNTSGDAPMTAAQRFIAANPSAGRTLAQANQAYSVYQSATRKVPA